MGSNTAVMAEKMTFMSSIARRFIHAMLDVIERCGFSSAEFLEKSELFLRSITPSYRKESFIAICKVFREVDPNLVDTEFYRSLLALREICTQENNNLKKVLSDSGIGFYVANLDEDDITNLIIFITHLIENLIRHVQSLRLDKTKNLDIADIRSSIESNFQQAMLYTLLQGREASEV